MFIVTEYAALRQTDDLLRDLHQYAISHIEVTSHKIWPTSNEMSKKKEKQLVQPYLAIIFVLKMSSAF